MLDALEKGCQELAFWPWSAFHSDRGVPYASAAFRKRLEQLAGFLQPAPPAFQLGLSHPRPI